MGIKPRANAAATIAAPAISCSRCQQHHRPLDYRVFIFQHVF
jgi:hypothetical protein